MPRGVRSEEATLLRLAIVEALGTFSEPVPASEVASHTVLNSLGVDTSRVSTILGQMVIAKRPLVRRIRAPYSAGFGESNGMWRYYDPKKFTPPEHQIRDAAPEPRQAKEAAIDKAVGQAFDFSPRQFESEMPAEPALHADPAPTVNVQQGVESLTITVGQVRIEIRLSR